MPKESIKALCLESSLLDATGRNGPFEPENVRSLNRHHRLRQLLVQAALLVVAELSQLENHANQAGERQHHSAGAVQQFLAVYYPIAVNTRLLSQSFSIAVTELSSGQGGSWLP